MIVASLLLAAAGQQIERDPTWGRAGGWTISRGSGGCIAESAGFVLRAAETGGSFLIARGPEWARRRDIHVLTFAHPDPRQRQPRFVFPVQWEDAGDGQSGIAIFLSDDQAMALSWRTLSLFSGKGRKGEALGSVDFGSLSSAIRLARRCTSATAAERDAKPVRGKPMPLVPISQIIDSEDYPAPALRAEQQGVTGIRIVFGEDGYPEACEVTATSGSALLDSEACRIVRWRIRVPPPLDDAGRPTRPVVYTRFRWELPR